MKYELYVYQYFCDGIYDWCLIGTGTKKEMMDRAKACGNGRVCKEGEGPYD